jgi:phage terminase large subunit GpA-like protein
MPRKAAARAPDQQRMRIGADIARAATPPPILTVSQWADRNRKLPESSGARGAQWRTADVPYLRGIMDAVHEPGVRRLALMKSAQVGGSEAINNILGFFIEHDPCPILLVQPAENVAEEWSKERLSDMLRTTPALAAVVTEAKKGAKGAKREHAGESTLLLKLFPGGFLALGGANTPNTFARRAARVTIGDDVDRFPPVVGEEGDPADLLVKRSTTFVDALNVMVSTPTLVGGRIHTLFERSDQRRYFVVCPACRREDWISWSHPEHFHVAWDGEDARTARVECPDVEHGGCGFRITEPVRRQIVAVGQWRPTAESREAGLIGFHLPAMVTTLGSASLQTWVEDWLAARAKGKESLRVFINTTLAEGWEDRGARMNSNALMNKREDYGEAIEIPAAAVAITAGVDVQENRFELIVMAWGLAMERWVIDKRVIPGSPKLAETRAALLEALSRRYVHASGHQLPIHATCIDTGYETEAVYDFVLAHQSRRIFATKGIAGREGEPIVGKPAEKRRGNQSRPVPLYPVNVDDAKGDVMDALTKITPGPNYIHFPLALDTIDEEFFSQLCAEHRETRYNRGGVATHRVWVQDRERNEALDCAVLCLGAYKLLNPNIRQLAEALAAAPPPGPGGSSPAQPPASQTQPQGRRVVRSSYLSR